MNCEGWSSGATKLGWAGQIEQSAAAARWVSASHVAALVWLFSVWVCNRTALLVSPWAWVWIARYAGLSSGITAWAWTARLSLSLSRLSLSFLLFFLFFLRFWLFCLVLESSTDCRVFFSFFSFFFYIFFKVFMGFCLLGWPARLR